MSEVQTAPPAPPAPEPAAFPANHRLYRCYNPACAAGSVPGFDFTAPTAGTACPKCKLPKADARHGHRIVERVVIHYEMPHPVQKNAGCGAIACRPDALDRGVQRVTGDPAAVTCPDCLASNVLGNYAFLAGLHPDYDSPVTIDMAKQTVKPCGCAGGN